ncbi:hypothetical protein [Modestobacter sp. I12A-02662]|uniref:hypothetical protein n=1 Tax=Modestobacter sp. I12A-02662 TaxID=1730496 RepID=UPI0034DF4ECA
MPLPAPVPGDHPIPADYDRDGVVDPAVWRSSDATWYVEPSAGGPTWARAIGSADTPTSPGEAAELSVLSGALSTLMWELWRTGARTEAVTAARARVAVHDRLAGADPDRFRSALAQALIDQAQFRTADPAGAVAAAQRAVTIMQELAGMAGGDYEAPASERLDAYVARAAGLDPALDDLVETRAALAALADVPAEDLERLMAQTVDLASHRLDAWITSFATQRLSWLRRPGGPAAGAGLGLGGYVWVEDLETRAAATEAGPVPDEPGPLRQDPLGAGYVHAPSVAHATTAAVLRGGYRAYARDDTSPFAIDLRSHRVQLASWLLDGVRNGQPLGALLGYRVERALHEHPRVGLAAFLPALRDLFPRRATAVSAEEGTTGPAVTAEVLDGLALHRAWSEDRLNLQTDLGATHADDRAALRQVLTVLSDTVDAVSDALLAEGVHQVVQGNPLRAGATLDAADRGEAPPPELDVARTPRTGVAVTHRLLVLLTDGAAPADWPLNPDVQARATVAPELNAWVAALLPAPDRVRYRAQAVRAPGGDVVRLDDLTLAALRVSPLDLLALPDADDDAAPAELTARLQAAVRARPDIGQTAEVRLDLTRDSSWDVDTVSVGELLDLVRGVRTLVGGARALAGPDLDTPDAPLVEPAVDAALAARAATAATLLQRAEADLAPGADDARLRRGLMRSAHLGVPAAVPGAGSLRDQADVVAQELARRQAALAQVTADGVQPDIDRLRAVFGAAFTVLPTCAVPPPFRTALAGSTAAQGGDSRAAAGWLHRVARVRRGADRFVTALSCAEACDTGASLRLSVVQLPHAAGERWLGLPLAGEPPGSRLSLLVHAPDGAGGDSAVGLVVDEWTEVIPSTAETTGVSFHFDAPGASAAQAVLLAVSPDERGRWSTELLEDTLFEALALAHLRTVDLEALRPTEPDAMTDVGQLLPAAHLAANVEVGDAIATDLTRGGE